MTEYELKDLLFVDIETATIYQEPSSLPELHSKCWELISPIEDYQNKGMLYPEFGKIISISIGIIYISKVDNTKQIKTKVIIGEEVEILNQFIEILSKYKNLTLVSHGCKKFEIPYLCKRLIINKISLPDCLKIVGKKPWEIKHQDTWEMWDFGIYSRTSLYLLSSLFNIEYNEKLLIKGEDMNDFYYATKDKDVYKEIMENNGSEKIKILIGVWLHLKSFS